MSLGQTFIANGWERPDGCCSSAWDDIDEAVEKEAAKYVQPLAVEVMRLKNIYPAEDYHQKYLDKNPTGYCHINPAMMNLKKR